MLDNDNFRGIVSKPTALNFKALEMEKQVYREMVMEVMVTVVMSQGVIDLYKMSKERYVVPKGVL